MKVMRGLLMVKGVSGGASLGTELWIIRVRIW